MSDQFNWLEALAGAAVAAMASIVIILWILEGVKNAGWL